MAKIWRRKRQGKFIGSYLVLVKGQRVNLRTEDANVARKRAALAMKGEWPAAENRRKAAADAAAASLEVEPESIPAAGDEAAPIKPLAAEPAPKPADLPPPPNAGTSDDAAAVAAAVEAASSDDGQAESQGPPEDEGSKRAEWRARFGAMFSGASSLGGGGMSPGQAVAMGTVVGLAEGIGRIGARAKPPRYLTFSVQPGDWRIAMLALGWDEQIRRWGLDLANVEPWHAILGGTCLLALAMATSMTTTAPGEGAPQSAGQP